MILGLLIIVYGIISWIKNRKTELFISIISLWLSLFAIGITYDTWRNHKEVMIELEYIKANLIPEEGSSYYNIPKTLEELKKMKNNSIRQYEENINHIQKVIINNF